jgi:hypothetical protein
MKRIIGYNDWFTDYGLFTEETSSLGITIMIYVARLK